jgi:Tol biopolymer transport system component
MEVTVFVLVVFLLVHSSSGLGNGQARVQPEVFGAGVLSEGEVFRGSFSPDGQTFYFFKKIRPRTEEYRVFSSRLVRGVWTAPAKVDLGGEHSNTYPTVSPDGRRLVFASSRPVPGYPTNFYLWQVEQAKKGWSDPVFLSQLNTPGQYHSWASFAADGRLYFRRTTPDWRTNQSFVASFSGSRPNVVTQDEVIESCKALAPDIRIVGGLPGPRSGLYFLDVAVPREGETPEHSDVWVCEYIAGAWVRPRPLGPEINSGAFETFPFFSPDGTYLYFVRGFSTFYRVRFDSAVSLESSSRQDRR